MATYNPLNISDPLFTQSFGNRVIFAGSATNTANLAIADKLRPLRVPAGTRVDRVVIKVPDLDSGATLAVTIGFEPIDGSTPPTGADVAVSAAGAWAQAAATTSYEIFPPYLVAKDSFLVITATAAGVGTGTVYAKVTGENLGPK